MNDTLSPNLTTPAASGICPELTGFDAPVEEPVTCCEPGRPLSMAWISDELLAETQRVWSKAYGRPIGEEEAVEILTNVKHLAQALMKAKQGGDAK